MTAIQLQNNTPLRYDQVPNEKVAFSVPASATDLFYHSVYRVSKKGNVYALWDLKKTDWKGFFGILNSLLILWNEGLKGLNKKDGERLKDLSNHMKRALGEFLIEQIRSFLKGEGVVAPTDAHVRAAGISRKTLENFLQSFVQFLNTVEGMLQKFEAEVLPQFENQAEAADWIAGMRYHVAAMRKFATEFESRVQATPSRPRNSLAKEVFADAYRVVAPVPLAPKRVVPVRMSLPVATPSEVPTITSSTSAFASSSAPVAAIASPARAEAPAPRREIPKPMISQSLREHFRTDVWSGPKEFSPEDYRTTVNIPELMNSSKKEMNAKLKKVLDEMERKLDKIKNLSNDFIFDFSKKYRRDKPNRLERKEFLLEYFRTLEFFEMMNGVSRENRDRISRLKVQAGLHFDTRVYDDYLYRHNV